MKKKAIVLIIIGAILIFAIGVLSGITFAKMNEKNKIEQTPVEPESKPVVLTEKQERELVENSVQELFSYINYDENNTENIEEDACYMLSGNYYDFLEDNKDIFNNVQYLINICLSKNNTQIIDFIDNPYGGSSVISKEDKEKLTDFFAEPTKYTLYDKSFIHLVENQDYEDYPEALKYADGNYYYIIHDSKAVNFLKFSYDKIEKIGNDYTTTVKVNDENTIYTGTLKIGVKDNHIVLYPLILNKAK